MWKWLVSLSVTLTLIASSSWAQLVPAREAARRALEANPNLEYSPTSVLVRFDERSGAHDRAAARAVVSGRVLDQYSVAGLEHIEVGIPVQQALAVLRALPGVVYAEPDYVVQSLGSPNDPYFGSLWGMQNIRAPEAWDVSTGDGDFIIAVIDSGVQYTHEDLVGNIWSGLGWDFYDGNDNPWDEYGHGTHVAGTIGAMGNNGIGVIGVNWEVQIMALRFLGPDGRGFISDAVLALQYAVNNGATISNNSWGGGGFSQSMYDMIQWAGTQGHLFICAAGNNGNDLDRSHPVFSYAAYPPSYNLPNMISVAAIDSSDNLASFSNYGVETIHLGAPGVSILSTYLDDRYATMNGTSMASPHVAGAAALYWAANPEATMSEVRQQILSTVRPLSSLDGRTSTGGTLDAAAVMGASSGGGDPPTGPEPTEPPPTPTDFAASAEPGREVLLTWSHDAEATDHLEIERERLQGPNWRGRTVIVVDGNASAHIDSPGNGTFRYRIRAVNDGGESGWTGHREVTTSN